MRRTRDGHLLWLIPVAVLIPVALLVTVAFLVTAALLLARVSVAADVPASEALVRPAIVIAFTSFRDDNRYANVFRYELSPTGEGKLAGKVEPGSKRSDHHPSLSLNGEQAAFAGEVVGNVNQIHFQNFVKNKTTSLPSLNVSTTAQMAPSYCSSAGLIVFEAWNRPGSSGRWDVLLYNVEDQQFVDAPALNSAKFDERKPAISPDGNWIAFTTNEQSAQSLTDVRIYDRQKNEVEMLAGLNSNSMDTEPSLSRDGRLIAFVSDRSGGSGVRDIYLFDRQARKLLALPGLNSAGQEQSPSISADGRFIAFVSERLDGAGERDIYLYDRRLQKLVPIPDLNSPGDEYDPCIVVLSQKD